MAIVIEQEKRQMNWIGMIGVLVVLGILAVSAYYLFFASPPIVENFISPKLETVDDFKKINEIEKDNGFDVVVSDPQFKALNKNFEIKIPSSEMIGKANPFLP